MKNIKKIIFTIFSIFLVTACANVSVKEDLQENNWNMVQSDGNSGEADFADDTVVFSSSNVLAMTTGYQYTLNEDETEITFTRDKPSYTGNESEKVIMKYTIEKRDDEYLLTLISDSSGESEKGFTITLIPKEAESTNEN
jgi:hypothetical protein